MIPDKIIIHKKCGLPLELCVCGGENDVHAVVSCICDLCGKEWVTVVPPGVPIQDYQCPKCMKTGYTKTRG